MDCTIQAVRRDEIGFAIGLAAAEGWNPGLHDAGCFQGFSDFWAAAGANSSGAA